MRKSDFYCYKVPNISKVVDGSLSTTMQLLPRDSSQKLKLVPFDISMYLRRSDEDTSLLYLVNTQELITSTDIKSLEIDKSWYTPTNSILYDVNINYKANRRVLQNEYKLSIKDILLKDEGKYIARNIAYTTQDIKFVSMDRLLEITAEVYERHIKDFVSYMITYDNTYKGSGWSNTNYSYSTSDCFIKKNLSLNSVIEYEGTEKRLKEWIMDSDFLGENEILKDGRLLDENIRTYNQSKMPLGLIFHKLMFYSMFFILHTFFFFDVCFIETGRIRNMRYFIESIESSMNAEARSIFCLSAFYIPTEIYKSVKKTLDSLSDIDRDFKETLELILTNGYDIYKKVSETTEKDLNKKLNQKNMSSYCDKVYDIITDVKQKTVRQPEFIIDYTYAEAFRFISLSEFEDEWKYLIDNNSDFQLLKDQLTIRIKNDMSTGSIATTLWDGLRPDSSRHIKGLLRMIPAVLKCFSHIYYGYSVKEMSLGFGVHNKHNLLTNKTLNMFRVCGTKYGDSDISDISTEETKMGYYNFVQPEITLYTSSITATSFEGDLMRFKVHIEMVAEEMKILLGFDEHRGNKISVDKSLKELVGYFTACILKNEGFIRLISEYIKTDSDNMDLYLKKLQEDCTDPVEKLVIQFVRDITEEFLNSIQKKYDQTYGVRSGENEKAQKNKLYVISNPDIHTKDYGILYEDLNLHDLMKQNLKNELGLDDNISRMESKILKYDNKSHIESINDRIDQIIYDILEITNNGVYKSESVIKTREVLSELFDFSMSNNLSKDDMDVIGTGRTGIGNTDIYLDINVFKLKYIIEYLKSILFVCRNTIPTHTIYEQICMQPDLNQYQIYSNRPIMKNIVTTFDLDSIKYCTKLNLVNNNKGFYTINGVYPTRSDIPYSFYKGTTNKKFILPGNSNVISVHNYTDGNLVEYYNNQPDLIRVSDLINTCYISRILPSVNTNNINDENYILYNNITLPTLAEDIGRMNDKEIDYNITVITPESLREISNRPYKLLGKHGSHHSRVLTAEHIFNLNMCRTYLNNHLLFSDKDGLNKKYYYDQSNRTAVKKVQFNLSEPFNQILLSFDDYFNTDYPTSTDIYNIMPESMQSLYRLYNNLCELCYELTEMDISLRPSEEMNKWEKIQKEIETDPKYTDYLSSLKYYANNTNNLLDSLSYEVQPPEIELIKSSMHIELSDDEEVELDFSRPVFDSNPRRVTKNKPSKKALNDGGQLCNDLTQYLNGVYCGYSVKEISLSYAPDIALVANEEKTSDEVSMTLNKIFDLNKFCAVRRKYLSDTTSNLNTQGADLRFHYENIFSIWDSLSVEERDHFVNYILDILEFNERIKRVFQQKDVNHDVYTYLKILKSYERDMISIINNSDKSDMGLLDLIGLCNMVEDKDNNMLLRDYVPSVELPNLNLNSKEVLHKYKEKYPLQLKSVIRPYRIRMELSVPTIKAHDIRTASKINSSMSKSGSLTKSGYKMSDSLEKLIDKKMNKLKTNDTMIRDYSFLKDIGLRSENITNKKSIDIEKTQAISFGVE